MADAGANGAAAAGEAGGAKAASSFGGARVCHGHTRPIVQLQYSAVTADGVFLVSASKGAAHAPPPPGLPLLVP